MRSAVVTGDRFDSSPADDADTSPPAEKVNTSSPADNADTSWPADDAVEVPLAAEVLWQSPRGDSSPLSAARMLELRRSEHRTIFWLALAMLVLAVVLQLDENGVVYLPLLNLRMPGVCWFRNSLGIDCPGCGLTRSVISWVHLQPAAAWHFNPAGILIATLAIFSVPYSAIQLRRLSQGKPSWWHPPLIWFGLVIGLVLIGQWIYKLKFGEI